MTCGTSATPRTTSLSETLFSNDFHELNDPKGQENIICTMIYGTALAAVKIN